MRHGVPRVRRSPKRSALSDDPRLGSVVADRYHLTRVIGEGGMGSVYEAVDLRERKAVAVKVLHPHLVARADVAARFRREGVVGGAVDSRHVVAVLDHGEAADGALYLVLELLSGHDLAAELATHGPLPVGRVARIATDVCSALEVAHARGIVHRDLKPENVFLARDGEAGEVVKVLDFGISKLREAIDPSLTPLTRTGTTLGTPYYMAPEQAQGMKEIDHRVDLYALGVVIFRMLTAQHPFDDPSYPMLVLKICTEAPPPLGRYRADVPSGLDALVCHLLAKRPDRRPGSAIEVRRALEPFAGHDAVPVLIDAPPTSASRPSALAARRVDSPEAHAATAPATSVAWQSGPNLPAADEGAGHDDDDDGQRERLVTGPRGSGAATRWILLAGVALALVLGTVLVLTMSTDHAVDRDPALPDPKPLEVRALVAPGHEGIGWTWVNPLPRAMPTWHDVAVARRDLVALVGVRGQAARFASGGMFLWDTGTTADLHGVAWTGARDAIAVGDGGVIRALSLDGPSSEVASGVETNLRDVVAASPTEAWAVGDTGTLLAIEGGDTVTAVASGTQADLLGAFVAGDTIWVAGSEGTLLRVAGGHVARETSGTSATLRAVGGCPGGDLYVAGDQGELRRRHEDGTWRRVDHRLREPLCAIACDGDRAVVTGMRGGVLLVSRSRAVALPSGTDRSLRAASGARNAATWIAGDSGRLMQVESDHLRSLTAGPTVPLRDIGSIGGALVAVGEWGRVVREHENGLVQADSPTDAAFAALAPLGDDRLLAVGDGGVIALVLFGSVELVPSPSDTSWRDVVSDGQSILAVGVGGAVLRGTPGAFQETRVPDSGDLWSVAGTPSDAIAVGQGGLVLHIDAARSTRVPCDAGVTLRGVVRGPDGVYSVGEGGAIVRIEPDGCVVERAPTEGAPILEGVGVGPNGRALAVGAAGTALERGEDGGWEPANLDVGRVDLRAVGRDDRNAYIVGAGGVIVRHVLLDGT